MIIDQVQVQNCRGRSAGFWHPVVTTRAAGLILCSLDRVMRRCSTTIGRSGGPPRHCWRTIEVLLKLELWVAVGILRDGLLRPRVGGAGKQLTQLQHPELAGNDV